MEIDNTGLELNLEMKKRNPFSDFWRRFKKNRAAVIGLCLLSVILLLALFANFTGDYQTTAIKPNISNRYLPPSAEHWFGTDASGRDVFARVAYGARVSLAIGFVCVSCSIVVGGLIGAFAGYFGGLLDTIVMRIIDMFNCIPSVLLCLAIVASLGKGIQNLVIAITVACVPGFARIIRAVILPLVEQDYVEAARAYGTSNFRIVTRHIIPNAMGPIIVQATMSVAGIIISAAGLSFIGMGVQPPDPEWGAMLSAGNEAIRTAPYLVIFPGLAIVISALSLNLIGDGLRDALDPRLK